MAPSSSLYLSKRMRIVSTSSPTIGCKSPPLPPVISFPSLFNMRTPFAARGPRALATTQAVGMLFTMTGRDGQDPWRLRSWAVGGTQPGMGPVPVGPSDGVSLLTAKLQLPAEVVTVAVHAAAWPVLVVAAGLANGKVYILRGDAGLTRLLRHFRSISQRRLQAGPNSTNVDRQTRRSLMGL